MNKKLQSGIAALALSISFSSNAAMLAVETGLMDWRSSASDYFGESKNNNPYIKMIGAHGTALGDIYGHVTLENFDNTDIYGTEINLVGQINIGETDFNLYGQVFDKSMPVWGETNTLLGLSWDKNYDNTYVQLAFAAHIVNATYKAFDSNFDEQGFNGGYAYLNISHDLSLFDQDFKFVWWQEFYFGRNEQYLELAGDMEDFGFNGQLRANWIINNNWSVGVSYRYAENNLGKKGYHDAFFYSVQYKF
ncbi:hypothetical protein [Shewanella pealeana]|uniref:Ion channel protein Tsx n=1 Tax=Shewanella pealeana (strain ATCC 700345 / ANG-SQ1) TaxID=398579 RepID=A8H9U9_SHEPA|nr:hypothetical protein [Shewanella pealeana]ABV89336.1 hypothetical protein Spea_4026 [Shewanella pealeana ATCC 700345]